MCSPRYYTTANLHRISRNTKVQNSYSRSERKKRERSEDSDFRPLNFRKSYKKNRPLILVDFL